MRAILAASSFPLYQRNLIRERHGLQAAGLFCALNGALASFPVFQRALLNKCRLAGVVTAGSRKGCQALDFIH
jgi:hypothetical protein